MKSCSEIESLLPAFSEEDLSELEYDEVQTHLENCPECDRELQLLLASWQALEHLDSDVIEPSSHLRAQVWEELRREPQRQSSWHRWHRHPAARMTAAAATLVLGFFSGVWLATPAEVGPSRTQVAASSTPPPLDREMVALASEPGYSLDLFPDPSRFTPLDEELRMALNAPPIGQVEEDWLSAADDAYGDRVEFEFTNYGAP